MIGKYFVVYDKVLKNVNIFEINLKLGTQFFFSGFKSHGILSAHWHTSSEHSLETNLLLLGAE